jgi:hypothetical protein
VPAGTDVGTLTTTDPDAGDTFTYTFATGTGDTDNASFAIVGDKVQTVAALDFDTKSSYSIRVRSTDAEGLFTEETFVITVTDVNEAPTAIALSNLTVADLSPAGTTIGTLSTTDPDAGDTFSYELVAGTGGDDNGSFEIVSGELRSTVELDFTANPTYSVRVQSVDADGLFVEQVFVISELI